MDANKAMEFLENHELAQAKKEMSEKDNMPIQYYLSTWDIAKIMAEYAEQRPKNISST